jgi:hypothetical protein
MSTFCLSVLLLSYLPVGAGIGVSRERDGRDASEQGRAVAAGGRRVRGRRHRPSRGLAAARMEVRALSVVRMPALVMEMVCAHNTHPCKL